MKTHRILSICLPLVLTALPVAAEDWSGFYAGIFGGTSQIQGNHPRWPDTPLLGFVDGTISLFSQTGSGAGTNYTTFSVPHGNLAEVGGVFGYTHRIDDTPFLIGAEASASLANKQDTGWGATRMISAELGGSYSRGSSEAWFVGGPSIEMMLRGGLVVHEKAAVFLSAGIAVDQRGLALSYERSGPGTLAFGSLSFTEIPGVKSTLQVQYSPDVHIAPAVGVGAEFAILEGWRLRADYQARWTSPQTLSLQVVRSTSDPVGYPVTSDTAALTINGYVTHAFRLGITRSFSSQ